MSMHNNVHSQATVRHLPLQNGERTCYTESHVFAVDHKLQLASYLKILFFCVLFKYIHHTNAAVMCCHNVDGKLVVKTLFVAPEGIICLK